MDVTRVVRAYVDICKEREPIIIKDINFGKEYENARNVAFNRLYKENVIKLFGKGIYYKPKNTPFGEIGIDKQQLINKKYVKRENHVMGYLTGPALWNLWNITTQIPNRTWIVTNVAKRNEDKDDLKVKLFKPKVPVTNINYELLQFLDVVDQAFQIQDIDFRSYVSILMNKLDTFNKNQILSIIELTKHYNKFVNNFIGVLIENKINAINEDMAINKELVEMKLRANRGKKYKLIKNIGINNAKNWGFY